MPSRRTSDGPSQDKVERELGTLATALTACLIRSGGKLAFTEAEWRAGVDHEGQLFFSPAGDDGVEIALIGKPVDA